MTSVVTEVRMCIMCIRCMCCICLVEYTTVIIYLSDPYLFSVCQKLHVILICDAEMATACMVPVF